MSLTYYHRKSKRDNGRKQPGGEASQRMALPGPLPIADIKNRNAMTNKTGFLPYRSAGPPVKRGPATVPMSAEAIVKLCQNGDKSNNACVFFSTPGITAVSNPNRKPPGANITDHTRTLTCLLSMKSLACIVFRKLPVRRHFIFWIKIQFFLK